MKIYLNNVAYQLEVSSFLKGYYPNEEMVFQEKPTEPCDYSIFVHEDLVKVQCYEQGFLVHEQKMDAEQIRATHLPNDSIQKRKHLKKLIKQIIIDVASKHSKYEQPWGILNGIRPTKVVFQLQEKYGTDFELISQILKNEYRLHDDKLKLMMAVALKEKEIISKNEKDELSIYIGIPFCPTKCLYCSFTSYPIYQDQSLTMVYLDALEKELSLLRSKEFSNRKIRSIYIGGGTPTSLDEVGLQKLMTMIHQTMDVERIDEFTVEAGRPDTINQEKLEILMKSGVNRLSINPQTMKQKTLDLIGRGHTVEDLKNAVYLARKVGFHNINMDIIIGLPGETIDDVADTLHEIEKLAPEHVTVHTMAIKRGSRLKETKEKFTELDAREIQDMLSLVNEKINQMGLEPYYLYRQKYILGNFENVGYAKKGLECIYNVESIEEQEPVLAFGAGSVTKWVDGENKTITRIENLKNVEQYISRIDEMIGRKMNIVKKA